MANIPCITTVQGLGAAVQGIEALDRGDDRRPVAAGLGRTAVRCGREPRPPSLFDHVLTRTDPEQAHHAAFRAIRAGRPVTGLLPTSDAGVARSRRSG